MNKQFIEPKSWIANNYLKMGSDSLEFRDAEIKTAMQYHNIPYFYR